jgi:hypothetical protein
MMKFLSRLARSRRGDEPQREILEEPACYRSTVRVSSKAMPGVMFEIKRISFGRRTDLAKRVREISQRVEFLEAGGELREKIEASLLKQEIEAIYLQWALVRVEGLTIDGELVTTERLLDRGPEELTHEIVAAIKTECGLTGDERKN